MIAPAAVGCKRWLAGCCLVFTIHLLRVANDLIIAGPRPGAHDPPWGDGHRPAVARAGVPLDHDGGIEGFSARRLLAWAVFVTRRQEMFSVVLASWDGGGLAARAAAGKGDEHFRTNQPAAVALHPLS